MSALSPLARVPRSEFPARPCDNHPAAANMSESRLIFERQGLHLLLLAVLITFAGWLARYWVSGGHFLNVPASSWFWAAIAVAILHQGWVWLCWRLQLHKGLLTQWAGPAGFRLYAAGFALLALTRIGVLICLALADRGTVPADGRLLDALATILLVPVGYLFYSVARYFHVSTSGGRGSLRYGLPFQAARETRHLPLHKKRNVHLRTAARLAARTLCSLSSGATGRGVQSHLHLGALPLHRASRHEEDLRRPVGPRSITLRPAIR